MAFAVRRYSHWQGSQNPGEVVAVVKTHEEAERLADRLSTCSFCSPGRTTNYSVGDCYCIRKTIRYSPGYGLDDIDEAILEDAKIDVNVF